MVSYIIKQTFDIANISYSLVFLVTWKYSDRVRNGAWLVNFIPGGSKRLYLTHCKCHKDIKTMKIERFITKLQVSIWVRNLTS